MKRDRAAMPHGTVDRLMSEAAGDRTMEAPEVAPAATAPLVTGAAGRVLDTPEPPAARDEHIKVKLTRLQESRTNPRRHFTETDIDDLAASLKEHGVLQPLLVRPHGKDEVGERYEVVFGARRYRAARKAGLAEVPVRVRDLTDLECLEVQLVENLQRSDVHPLDEADGYHVLQQKHGYSVEQLAGKVGKSTGYIYSRLKYCSLAKGPRKAFLAGELTPTVALMIARIPDQDLQEKATKEIAGREMSARRASEHLQEFYMLRLAEAQFPTGDPLLVPAAGACSVCPKRTGTQTELFSDVKSPYVCTDPACFKLKTDTAWKQRAQERLAAGKQVLEGKEAERALQDRFISKGAFVSAADACVLDPKGRNYEAALGHKRIDEHVVLARDPHTQKIHKLIPRTVLPELVKDAGLKKAAAAKPVVEDRWTRDQRAREVKARLETATRKRIVESVLQKVPAALTIVELRLIAEGFALATWSEYCKRIAAAWGWDKKDKKPGLDSWPVVVAREALKLELRDCQKLLMQLALMRDVQQEFGDGAKRLDMIAGHYKIDVAAIRKMVKGDAAPKKKAPASAVKKASTKKR